MFGLDPSRRAVLIQSMLRSLILASGLFLAMPSGGFAATSPQEDDAASLCAGPTDAAIAGKWRDLGAGEGRLGCPNGREEGLATASGKAFIVMQFDGGVLVRPATRAFAPNVMLVWGCIYRMYIQQGGLTGWMGAPLGDPENTPDGQKQRFEHGLARFYRATSSCDVERSP